MKPSISYQAYCQKIGWQEPAHEGIAGTTGRKLRLEALRIHLLNAGNASLSIDIHLQDIGWIFNLNENDMLGTIGQSRRMEAIVIRSKGLHEQGYRIQYKVHVQDIGWQNWVNEGEMAGTTGKSKRMEAIEIRLVNDLSIQIRPYIQTTTINNFYTNINLQICVKNEQLKVLQNFLKTIEYQ